MPIIEQKISPIASCIQTVGAYNVLDVFEFKHYQTNHSKLLNQQDYIKGIENFWNQANRHMIKFKSVLRNHFNLFLKKSEWRLNSGGPEDRQKTKKNTKRILLGVRTLNIL